MKNIAPWIALTLSLALAPCLAKEPNAHEAEFKAFQTAFLAAAAANDKEKVADLIVFPVDDWSIERKGDVQTGAIKDKAEFLARYDELFSPSLRAHLAKAKAEPLSDGRYILIWHDGGAEFAFNVSYIDKVGYRVTSYDIGPE